MLTRKQHELLMFIHERLKESGVPPSFDEMKDALDLRSKSGIHRLITALEERGFIHRLPNRARALEVIKMPESSVPGGVRRKGFNPTVVDGTLGQSGNQTAPTQKAGESAPSTERDSLAVPVMGRIAAGVPIAAIQTHSHTVHVPIEMVASGEHFALEVRGDSMIEAGILDGDTVVIKKTDTANNGDIVVALINDEEATLKRFRRRGGAVALEAANPAYEPRIVRPDQLKVQGRLVGLIRRYN